MQHSTVLITPLMHCHCKPATRLTSQFL